MNARHVFGAATATSSRPPRAQAVAAEFELELRRFKADAQEFSTTQLRQQYSASGSSRARKAAKRADLRVRVVESRKAVTATSESLSGRRSGAGER